MPSNKLISKLLFVGLLLLFVNTYSQVGINTNTPGDGAVLEIYSEDKGLLIPRLNITDLSTIAPIAFDTAAEESLLVYNTNTASGKGFHYWSGATWIKIAEGLSTDWTTTGNSGTTPASNFIGTTDDQGFAFRTNDTERMRLTEEQYVDSDGNSWAYLGIGTTNPGEILDVNGDIDVGGDFDDHDGISETIKIRAQSHSWFLGVKNDPVDDENDYFIGQTDNADDAPLRISSDDEYVSIGSDDDEPQDILHITQDQTGTTTLRIDNTDSDGFTSLELWDGSSPEAYFTHDNSSNDLDIGHSENGGKIDFFVGSSRAITIENNDVRIYGDLNVTGSVAKGGGTFKIDHPLDPTNKYLYHSFVESPDMLNIYNGNITTDATGTAVVTLPRYFSALNKDYKYQVSALKSFSDVMILEEIKGNSFKIKSELPNTEISWQVTGVRQDAYANKNRVIPEVEKEPSKKGTLLHPDAYRMQSTLQKENH
jgi:hypothetical protein